MLGAILSLAAVGFSLIFGVLHVINLSHGILVLMGAYLALVLAGSALDPLLCFPRSLLRFAFGYVYQRFLISPAIRAPPAQFVAPTFGVALMPRIA